ncbi:MAG: acyltransferase [Candidatus Omnitrophica bacterium]|nr:acyltransferase [Candidatus Omnitrophota bacterium]
MGKRISGVLKKTYIDKRAVVAKSARIGEGTKVWAFAQVGDNAKIGKNCVIGNGAYIDRNVIVGNNVKIHNKALLYNGLIVEDNCFIGPGACFANDKRPCFNKTRNLKGVSWRLKKGSSVGANATILPDVTIGENSIVGAGSVVTKDIPSNVTACGNPARILRRENAKKSAKPQKLPKL